jgi:nicotinate-nucleotide pyrophosphorylase (carboxylating)
MKEAIHRAKLHADGLPIIIECDTLEQVEQALQPNIARLLLDNMTPDQLRIAVKLVHGRIPLEASGGITLQNITIIAETGIDYISVGKLTHSAKAVDVSLDI